MEFCICDDILGSFSGVFSVWVPSWFQCCFGVDFGSKNRQKSSPFWSPDSIFSVLNLWYIFDVFCYHVSMTIWVDFWTIFDPIWGTFSDHFHDHMWKFNFIDFWRTSHAFFNILRGRRVQKSMKIRSQITWKSHCKNMQILAWFLKDF